MIACGGEGVCGAEICDILWAVQKAVNSELFSSFLLPPHPFTLLFSPPGISLCKTELYCLLDGLKRGRGPKRKGRSVQLDEEGSVDQRAEEQTEVCRGKNAVIEHLSTLL